MVTYDLMSSLKIIDYMYFIHDGVIAAAGTVEEMINSQDPSVYQFLHAQPDGPISFQYPSKPYAEDLSIKA